MYDRENDDNYGRPLKNPWVHGSSSGQLTVTDTIGEIQMLSMVMNN